MTGIAVAGAAPQAIVSNPVQAAMDAFKAGQDPSVAVYGKADAVKGIGASGDEGGEESADMDSSVTDGDESSSTEDAEGSSDSEDSGVQDVPATQEAKTEDIEYINVTDDSGKKRLKIDWNDKETIKKQLSLLAGARKWQAERDSALAKVKEVEGKQDSIKAWDAIESAWTKSGLEGVVDLLGGKQGHFKEWRDAEFAKVAQYNAASQPERDFMDMQERLSKQAKENEELTTRLKGESEKSIQKKQEAEAAEMRSYAVDAFSKHRFDGTMGDPVAEQQINEVVWSQALSKIDAMPEGTAITPALMEREFKAAADLFRKHISTQVASGTKKMIEQKKEQAQNKLNEAGKASTKPATKESEQFTKDVKSGNIGDALRALMMGKVKL